MTLETNKNCLKKLGNFLFDKHFGHRKIDACYLQLISLTLLFSDFDGDEDGTEEEVSDCDYYEEEVDHICHYVRLLRLSTQSHYLLNEPQ